MCPTSYRWIQGDSRGMSPSPEMFFGPLKNLNWTGLDSWWNGLEFRVQMDSSLVQVEYFPVESSGIHLNPLEST